MPERETPRTNALLCAAVVAVFGVLYLVLSKVAFRGFPFSGDEYSTLLQAEIFARGSLATPAPAHAPLFLVDHVIIDDLVRSKYPPGTAALLVLGVLARAPWIVTPLEATIALALFGSIARVMFGDRAALVTLLVAGASPLFAVHAASFYSHAAVTMWIAIVLRALVKHEADPRPPWLLLAGVALGCAFLTRPLEAALFGATLLALRDARALAWIALGAIPVAALTFIYQKAQFGSPFLNGYRVYGPTFEALYGSEGAKKNISLGNALDLDLQWNHLDLIRAFFVEWTVPGAIALALIGGAARPRAAARLREAMIALVVLTLISLVPTHTAPDDGPLPRYLASLLIPMAVFAGPGWLAVEEMATARGARRWANVAAWASVVVAVLSIVSFLTVRLPALWQREGLARAVEARGLRDAVVVVHAEFPSRYTRNGPGFDGSVLYVRAGVASDAEIAAWFPGRALYEATEGPVWSIRPLVPAS